MDLCGLKLLKYELHCDFLPLCEQVPKQALKTVCYSIRDTRWTTVIYKCSLKLWGRQVFLWRVNLSQAMPLPPIDLFSFKEKAHNFTNPNWKMQNSLPCWCSRCCSWEFRFSFDKEILAFSVSAGGPKNIHLCLFWQASC